MQYKAIIFDFDNTIAKTREGVCELILWSLRQVGNKTLVLNLQDIHRILEQTEHFDLALKYIANEYGYDFNHILSIYRKNSTQVKYALCDGFKGFFDTCLENRTNLKLLLVTNRVNLLDLRLGDCGMSRSDFDFVIQPTIKDEQKPSSFMMQKAMEYLNQFDINSSDVLSIGDNIVDYQAGKDFGFDFAAVLGGASTCQEFLDLGLDKSRVFEKISHIC